MPTTRFLLEGIILASIASSLVAFYVFFLTRDYWVYANVPCDPSQYSCFIGDGEAAPQFYKIIEKKAYAIPPCDAWAGECYLLACSLTDNENVCIETYCSPDSGDSCSFDGNN